MPRAHRRPSLLRLRRLLRPAATGLSLSLAALVTACISADPESSAGRTPAAPGAVAPSANAFAFSFDGGQSVEGWFPIRKGIEIGQTAEGNAAEIRYRRDRGTASGVALSLEPGACASLEAIVLRGASAPAQRIHLCLTDAHGVVWTLPTLKLGSEIETHRVLAAEIVPDPFQNAGKTVPAKPDWSSMRMLTVLDISGHMGAPVETVAWRIESIVGEEGTR